MWRKARIGISGQLLPLLLAGLSLGQDEPVFSGPQVGEMLVPFKVTGVYDAVAGQPLDWVAQAAGKPTLLIFVHPPLTRPSAAVTRTLSDYAKTREKDGLITGVVWLADDPSAAEQYLKQARRSLNIAMPIGISPDGVEGPGAYGLNRKVSLTILVAKDNRVTANFAWVQPSLTEVPRVLAEVVKLIGGEVPTLKQLNPGAAMAMKRPAGDPAFRELLAPVIKLGAASEDVDKAAASVEEYVRGNNPRERELGRIASTIVSSGRIANYGTPRAQEILRRWADKFGPKPN